MIARQLSRWPVWGICVATSMTVATLLPAFSGEDGFPLSNYPMFSAPKRTHAQVFHVLARSSQGRHRPVPPEAMGTDEIMQAYQSVKLAIRGGPSSTAELCARVAQWVAIHEEYADIVTLQVRADVYDAIEYWSDSRAPVWSQVAGACEVAR